MPTIRLRTLLLRRLARGATTAGELGLAMLMSAGVVYCGGSTNTGGGGETGDAAPDHAGPWVEAAQGDAGVVIEAAPWDGSVADARDGSIVVEAARDGSIVVEAAPAPDGSLDATGADGSPHPLPEAAAP